MHRGAIFMLLSALSFSLMTALVKIAGARLPSQEIVVARALVSLVLSWQLLYRAGVSPWGHDKRWLWIRGALGFAGLSCVFAAVTRLPLAEATVLQYLHPALTALFAGLFLGEAIGRRIVLATIASLFGVVLVAQPAVVFGESAAALEPRWVAVALAGAAFSAAAYVVVRRLSRTEHPLVIVFYFPLVTVPAALPSLMGAFVWPRGIEWLWLLGVGLTAQAGQIWLTRGLTLLPAARGTALSYLQVVFAAGWGVLLFGESLALSTILGGGMIVSAALWIAAARSDA